MKRFWVILGALAMVCALNTVAGAVTLAKENIGWLDQTRTSLWQVKDKTAITNSGTSIDTTAMFSLLGKALPPSKLDAANVDSTLMAQIVFCTDSSAVVTNDLTLPNVVLETSDDGVNWQAAWTVNFTVTSGAKSWALPIWVKTGEGFGAGNVVQNPYFARMIRARITGATGNQYAVRAELWFWKD